MPAPHRSGGNLKTKRPGRSTQTPGEAEHLTSAIHALGDYRHVTVEAQRGFLRVLVNDDPVARLTPLGRDHYGLSFQHHSGRWEPTPFTGDLVHLASVLATEFAAYLASYGFPPTKNGSAH